MTKFQIQLLLVASLLVLIVSGSLAFRKPPSETPPEATYRYRPLSELKLNTTNRDEYFIGQHEVVPTTEPITAAVPPLAHQARLSLNNAHPGLPNTGAGDFDTSIKATSTGSLAEAVPKSSQAKAGLYQLQVTDTVTGQVVSDQTVAWGVLVFNSDYAAYPINTKANLAMAVLDDRGKMICDAEMTLVITEPNGQTKTLSTANNQILINEACFVYGLTQEPDYVAEYLPTQAGNYQVALTARIGNGVRTLHDQFSVVENAPFYLQRIGASRTYPAASYPYAFNFQPTQSGRYQLTENVPGSFEILDLTIDGDPCPTESLLNAGTCKIEVSEDGNEKLISWQFNARANRDVKIAYTFKGPSISPYLFRLGPVEVTSSDDSIWTETRSWLIASDAACQSNGTGGGNSNVAGSWQTCGGTTPQATDSITVLSGDTITMNAALSVTSIVINDGGVFTNNASPFTLTLTGTTGTLFTLGATGTFTPGTSITVTMNPNASIATTSGVITFFDLNFTPTIAASNKTYTMGSGALTINGNWNITGTAASNALTLTVNMGANVTVASTKTTTIGPASLTNAATLDLQPSLASYNLTTGTLAITALGTLNAAGATSAIAVANSYSNSGIFTAGTSTVSFTATATGKTLSGTLSGANGKFFNIIFNGVGGAWAFGATVEAANDFTVTNGAVTASNNNLIVTRDFTLANTSGVSYIAGSSTITVTRHVNDSGVKFSSGTSTLIMNGTGTITTTGASSLYNFSLAYTGFTTTISVGGSFVFATNVVTVNGGTVTGTNAGINVRCAVTCSNRFVFAAATSFTGSGDNRINYSSGATGITITVTAGNYGGWGIQTIPPFNNTTYSWGGTLTTTSYYHFSASASVSGSVLNTANQTLTAGRFEQGVSARTATTTVNFGSSAINLTSTTDNLIVSSNGGSHNLNLETSSVNVKGNVLFVNGTGTTTVNPGTSTVTWSHTSGSKTYAPNGQSLYNFILNGTGGTVVPTAAVDVDNNFTITAGTFDVTTAPHNVTIGGNLIGGSGVWTLEMRSATWTISGNWDTSAVAGDYTPISQGTSTIIMDGAGTKTITTGNAITYETRFYNLQVGVSAGKTTQMQQSFGFAGVLTLGDGTIDLNSKNIYATGGVTDPLSLSALGTWGTGNGTLFFYGGINMNLPAFTYNSGFTVELASGPTVSLQGTTIITGNLTLGCCGRASHLDTVNQTLTVNGNVVWGSASAILTAGSSTIAVGGSWDNSLAGVFNANTSTVTFTSTVAGQTIHSGGRSYYNLQFDGVAGGWGFSAAVAATNDFTVTNGDVTANNNSLTVTRDLTLTNVAGVSYTAGSSTITVSRHYNNPGDRFIRGTSLVILNGTGNVNTTGGKFNNLSLAYASQVTTFNTTNFAVYGVLTFNGGTANGSADGYVSLERSISGTPVVFASATTLSGTSRTLFHNNNANSLTTTIAGGNYGTWNIISFDTIGPATSSIYQLAGDITTTGYVTLQAAGGSTGNVFNTQNFNITSLRFDLGTESRIGPWTINFGSSTLALSDTANSFGVASNGGAHTFNLSTATINTVGNVLFANGTGTVAVSPGTSTVTWIHTSGTKTYAPNGQSLHNLTLNGTGGTVVPNGAVVATGNFTITAGTYDTVAGQDYALTIGGNYTNSGTFSAQGGTVTLNGSTTQALSGTMVGGSAFNNLIITNNSGTSASDCERTSFVPSVDFAAAAWTNDTYTITTANVRVEYNSGSTYAFTNINWNGQATGTRIYFRNSAASGTWLLDVSGAQTAVSYVNVSRSDAASSLEIIASDGTNFDCNNNSNWLFVSGSLSTDIVNAGGTPVDSPSIAMGAATFSLLYQTVSGTFGATNEKVRVSNTTVNPQWSLTIAATGGPTALWSTIITLDEYDFNDPTGSAVDGGDGDAYGGQLTMDVTGGTLGGTCSATGITKGSSASFSEGVINSITLLTASGTADVGCYWDLTDVDVLQSLPSQQAPSNYSINMTLTIVAN